MNYNKLVRDLIPQHLDSKGIKYQIHTANKNEYWEKLQENYLKK